MNLHDGYYLLKPLLPRFVQIALRRKLAQYKLPGWRNLAHFGVYGQ